MPSEIFIKSTVYVKYFLQMSVVRQKCYLKFDHILKELYIEIQVHLNQRPSHFLFWRLSSNYTCHLKISTLQYTKLVYAKLLADNDPINGCWDSCQDVLIMQLAPKCRECNLFCRLYHKRMAMELLIIILDSNMIP